MSSEGEVLVVEVLVDDTRHALRAMVALRTIVPDGLLVLDLDLEDVLGLAIVRDELEAGEEGAAVGEGHAGAAEAGLGDGVVLGEEVPLDDVADLGDDVVRVEAQAAQAGDDGVRDAVGGGVGGRVADDGGGDGGDAGGEEEGGGEGLEAEHFEVVEVVEVGYLR